MHLVITCTSGTAAPTACIPKTDIAAARSPLQINSQPFIKIVVIWLEFPATATHAAPAMPCTYPDKQIIQHYIC